MADKDTRKKAEEMSIMDKIKSKLTNTNVKKLKKMNKTRHGAEIKKGK